MDEHIEKLYKAAERLERCVAYDIGNYDGVTGPYINDLKTSIDMMVIYRRYLEDYYPKEK